MPRTKVDDALQLVACSITQLELANIDMPPFARVNRHLLELDIKQLPCDHGETFQTCTQSEELSHTIRMRLEDLAAAWP